MRVCEHPVATCDVPGRVTGLRRCSFVETSNDVKMLLTMLMRDLYELSTPDRACTSKADVLLGRVAFGAQRPIVIKLSRVRSVGRSVCLSVQCIVDK